MNFKGSRGLCSCHLFMGNMTERNGVRLEIDISGYIGKKEQNIYSKQRANLLSHHHPEATLGADLTPRFQLA